MIAPYYDHGGIVIYHADCLEVLAELQGPAQAIVMDPPYCSGTRHEASKPARGAMLRGRRFGKPIENDQMTTTGFVWLLRQVCLSAGPLLADGASVLSFIDWRQWPNLVGAVESTNLRVNGMLVWDKESFGTGHGFRSQHELILHASKGVARICAHDTGNVIIGHRRDRGTEHPSPKPPGLIEALLRVVTQPGDLVIDPFVGAGATLLAAQALKLRAVGIECLEQHCETAARRLGRAP